jgi:hypothetical protein
MINRLVKIGTNHSQSVIMTGKWRLKERGIVFCENCESIICTRFPKPIDAEITPHPKNCIQVKISGGISIYHTDFIAQIRKYMDKFSIGKCHLPNGRVVEEYITCYTDTYIVERGDKQSEYDICDKCGSIAPAGWSGRQYTLRSYLTDEDAFNELYIDGELALQLDFSPWPDADLETIDVRNEPMDGQKLPCDK